MNNAARVGRIEGIGPKVEAAAGFVRDGGTRAVIADLEDATAALRGETGTTIVPSDA